MPKKWAFPQYKILPIIWETAILPEMGDTKNKKWRYTTGPQFKDWSLTDMQLTAKKVQEIPMSSLGILLAYLHGIDVKAKTSKNTYYSHRRVLKAYGFDISKPPKQK